MKTNILIILCASILYVLMPIKVLAYGASFDGGTLQGMDSTCSCSGGEVIKIKSYVDDQTHYYLYQPGVTHLYANYDIESSDAYFLTTLFPLAICLDGADDCEGSSGQSPEGIFLLNGTSFNDSKNSLMALLEKFPMVSNVTDAFSKALAQSSLKSADIKI